MAKTSELKYRKNMCVSGVRIDLLIMAGNKYYTWATILGIFSETWLQSQRIFSETDKVISCDHIGTCVE